MQATKGVNAPWVMVLVASAILMVAMGTRQSQGLFVSPMNTTTGLGIVNISFAVAVGHFVWGAIQPVAGAIADRYGPGRVLAAGVLAFAAGSALTPLVTSATGLVMTIGVLVAAGTGAASFSVLLGAVGRHLPVEKRGISAGVMNAGGSLGQFIVAPITQLLISAAGWMHAMWYLSVAALSLLPLTRVLRGRRTVHGSAASEPYSPGQQTESAEQGLRATVMQALGNRSYLLLHAGFFTCGFHISFLITHLPIEVQLCGQAPAVAGWAISIIGAANVCGSLVVGWGTQRYRSKYLLAWMYASRTALILAYLAAPKTAATFYIFAAGLGLTWLATVPPTATIVGKLFGPRYLATLFGLTLLSHQTGGFLGAWLGGIAVTHLGDYTLMWYVDAALATLAALINLPIREARIAPRLEPI